MTQSGSVRDVVAQLSLATKLQLITGADIWSTAGVPAQDIPSMVLTDGPHGLRLQKGSTSELRLEESLPATCFPTAAALGATWDRDLIEEVGRAFEYFSEDPVLSGTMAAAMVRGIQSEGVAACLKHFAANNQEGWRMRIDTIVDERTLRELYLSGFEIAIDEGRPWSVTSYNKVNGEHVGESRRLIADILRGEWGYDGLVVSDWLAVHDRPTSLRAGLDLEMPGSGKAWDQALRKGLATGAFTLDVLDAACGRVIDLARRTRSARERYPSGPADLQAHHALARRVSAAGTVLLSNDGILPLRDAPKVAVIGAFAWTPR